MRKSKINLNKINKQLTIYLQTDLTFLGQGDSYSKTIGEDKIQRSSQAFVHSTDAETLVGKKPVGKGLPFLPSKYKFPRLSQYVASLERTKDDVQFIHHYDENYIYSGSYICEFTEIKSGSYEGLTIIHEIEPTFNDSSRGEKDRIDFFSEQFEELIECYTNIFVLCILRNKTNIVIPPISATNDTVGCFGFDENPSAADGLLHN